MKSILLIVAAATILVLAAPVKVERHRSSPRAYARQLAAAQGWTGYQWDDLDWIVSRESSWNPCASYPRRHDCGYAGSNSCGIPQANPCPSLWRGRLWETRWAQVRWLIAYVRGRYGSPAVAKGYWLAHGSY